jgi:multicomponent Na+:H+ antiporter subunit D
MGAVLLRTGTVNGSDLGGLYKSMPWTTGFCMVGAASISAFPLFSGFVTKSMIMTAAALEGHAWVWVVLLFASAGVFHHAGIKIPYFAFFAHDSGIRVKEAPFNMLLAMAIAAVLCVGIGVAPQALYALLPYPVDYVPYTQSHVISQLQLLVFSALAFAVLMRTGIYPPELRAINLDFDWFYRRLAPRLAHWAFDVHAHIRARAAAAAARLGHACLERIRHAGGPSGLFERTTSSGRMALWVMVMLLGYLAMYHAP